ncbi:MAG: sterol desaturase family protein [Pseudomonadota bacterium]
MTPEILFKIIAGTVTHDVLRYAIGAGGVFAIINIALSHRLRDRKIRRQTPGWSQIRREVAISLRTILIFACTGVLISVGAQHGLIPIYLRVADYGWLWFWFSTALIIVAHDAWFYWSHRALHRPAIFRIAHRTHHRSHNPTPFTSYSFDATEAVVNAGFLPLFLVIVPMHPGAILIFVFHMMLRNALGHCGYEVFPADRAGRPVFSWLTSVTHHDLHHANARWNMGLYFTWWDRWMGTEHPDYLSEFARVAPRIGRTRTGLSAMAGLVLLMVLAGTQLRAEPLRGTYASPGLGMVVRFEPCAGSAKSTCGRLLWGWNMAGWHAAAVGDVVVHGLVQTESGWTGGQLTDPESGRVYRGSVRKLNSGILQLRGCAGPFCQTQDWRPLSRVRRSLSKL